MAWTANSYTVGEVAEIVAVMDREFVRGTVIVAIEALAVQLGRNPSAVKGKIDRLIVQGTLPNHRVVGNLPPKQSSGESRGDGFHTLVESYSDCQSRRAKVFVAPPIARPIWFEDSDRMMSMLTARR